MIVKIDIELFSEQSLFQKIDRCFYFFYERRYDFFLDDDSILESNWIQDARPENRELLMEAFENTINNSLKEDITISSINDVPNNSITMEEALVFLNNPVYIFLENAVNDGKFVAGILKKFKNKGKKCIRFLKAEWLQFRNGGGKNDIINQIKDALNYYEDKILNNSFYLRAIVIVDSDKYNPADLIDSNTILEKFCKENNIVLHILEKREMENYIPLELLEEVENIDHEKLDVIKSLNLEQQDYYDFDKGFNGKSQDKIDPIYADLSNDQFNKIKNGFSSDIKTKVELPKLFLSDNLTRESLKTKCEHQVNSEELLEIIYKINSLL